MRRLEYTRTIRALPGRTRNSAEAAMYLAHVVRERHRLEQERQSLEKRIRRIQARLTTITGAETKLAPALHPGCAPPEAKATPVVARTARSAGTAGATEVTLHY